MPIIKSAIKRMHQSNKARVRNQQTKRGLKAAIKSFTTKMTGVSLSQAQSEIDKAVKKNLLNKNTAARKKAQLARAAKEAGVKMVASAKKAAPKEAAKTVKPAAAKKPVTKKAAAKKPAAKKTTK